MSIFDEVRDLITLHPTINSKGQTNLAYKLLQPAKGFQETAQGVARAKQAPFQIQAPQIRLGNPIANFAANLPGQFIAGALNSPGQYVQGIARTGVNLGQGNFDPKQLAGSTAQIAQLPLLFLGGGAAKGALGAVEGSLGSRVLAGGLQGAKIGGGFGALQGFQSGVDIKNNSQYLANLGINTAAGAALGGAFGAATPLAGAGIRSVIRGGKGVYQRQVSAAAPQIVMESVRPEITPYTPAFQALKTPNTLHDIASAVARARTHIGDKDANLVLRQATNDFLPHFSGLNSLEKRNVWDYLVARATEQHPKFVPPQLKELDKYILDEAGRKIGQAGFARIPGKEKVGGGVDDVKKLALDAGLTDKAKVIEIPLNKIKGTDYTELDDALRSGRKLSVKEANDLIGRVDDPIVAGRKITSPIGVGQNPDGTFYLSSGNNRVTQALVNGDKTILAASNDFRTGKSFQEIAQSNVAQGRLSDVNNTLNSQKGFIKIPGREQSPIEKPIPAKINTERLNISPKAKATIDKSVEVLKPELEKIRGTRLSNQEVLQAAKQSQVLNKVVTREQTERAIAALTKARQAVAAGAEGKGISEDFINNLRIVSSQATDTGRKLQSFNINADPELGSVKQEVVQKMLDLGLKTDDIIKASEGVNFNNQKEVTAFYRQFVKPSINEIIDEFRYNNLLSSPKTHIVNAFSNLIQGGVLSPVTKLYSGVIDPIASRLTGRAQQHYLQEVPAYYRGALSSFGEAITGFSNALSGNTFIQRPDVSRLPTNKLGPLSYVSRALEAGDVFFRTIIKAGEKESLATRYAKMGKEVPEQLLNDEAAKKAAYYIFRGPVDPANKTGQGAALSYIDKFTSAVYGLRRVPGVGWFVPFIQTPMNIVKQGLEYNPLGAVTLKGAADPTEQLAKSLVGATVLSGAGWLALNDRTTWASPSDPKLKSEFYASGKQPYAIKIGDNWVSYSRIGPLAYPVALAAAIKYEWQDSPKALSNSNTEKLISVLRDQGKFFSDQSYVQGIGDLVKTLQGEQGFNIGTNVANLGGQLIPLESLQRWVAQIVDPIYRKSETIPQAFAKNIPFLSKTVPPYTTPTGEPSQRQYPVVNAFSPLQITKESGEDYYQNRQETLQINQLKNAIESGKITPQQAQQAISQQRSGFGQGAARPSLPTEATPQDITNKQAAKTFGSQFAGQSSGSGIKKFKVKKAKKSKLTSVKFPKARRGKRAKIKAPKLKQVKTAKVKLAKIKLPKVKKYKIAKLPKSLV